MLGKMCATCKRNDESGVNEDNPKRMLLGEEYEALCGEGGESSRARCREERKERDKNERNDARKEKGGSS